MAEYTDANEYDMLRMSMINAITNWENLDYKCKSEKHTNTCRHKLVRHETFTKYVIFCIIFLIVTTGLYVFGIRSSFSDLKEMQQYSSLFRDITMFILTGFLISSFIALTFHIGILSPCAFVNTPKTCIAELTSALNRLQLINQYASQKYEYVTRIPSTDRLDLNHTLQFLFKTAEGKQSLFIISNEWINIDEQNKTLRVNKHAFRGVLRTSDYNMEQFRETLNYQTSKKIKDKIVC